MNHDQQVRQEHPDWSDEQVAAEVAKRVEAEHKPDPAATPTPAPAENEAFARMRRENDELKARLDREAKDREERERREAEEQGKWQELAEAEKTKREALEAQQKAAEAARNAERAAGELRFKDSGYALYLLQQDRVDLADAAKVKDGLEALASSRPELVNGSPPPPSGGPAGGSKGDSPQLTAETLSKLTQEQILALPVEDVHRALTNG